MVTEPFARHVDQKDGAEDHQQDRPDIEEIKQPDGGDQLVANAAAATKPMTVAACTLSARRQKV